MAALPDAHIGAGGGQLGILAAGNVLFQEVENLLHLLPAFHFGLGEAFVVGAVHAHKPGGVHTPFVAFRHPEEADAHPLQVPVAVGPGFRHPPMEGPVVHTVFPVEIIFVGLNVGLDFFGVHAVHMEEHGGRLHELQFFVAHFVGDPAALGHVAVAGAVDEHLAPDRLDAALGSHRHSGQSSLFHNRSQEGGVVKDLYPGFLKHFVHDELQALRLEGGHMVVAHHDPGGEGRSGPDLGGVNGVAPCHHPVDDLLKKAPDDHILAPLIVAGHKRSYQALGGHTAAGSRLFQQQRVRPCPGRRNGGAHAGRSAADDDHICREPLFDFLYLHASSSKTHNHLARTLSR